ncbi:MAG TPA: P1 family peptidase [Thermoplasmata archaeon]|nr:P1 family peptidase [Thermoplasmata archaeon]
MARPSRAASSDGVVRGVRIGQAESPRGQSGVTAVIFDRPVPVVVDHRGGASGTYDIASLALDATFGRRWALFFSGGSLFGLDAASGIRQQILEAGGGVPVFQNPNRVVPIAGAVLFDLPRRVGGLPDYRGLGYEAARRATASRVAVGRVGAGAGATVGKYLGRASAMHGGLGWAASRIGIGTVGALVALNAVGAVRDPSSGRWVAGARGPARKIVPPAFVGALPRDETSTTLGLILTDLDVDRSVLLRAAAIAHAALGGVIVPFHTATDGDTMFAASTGEAGPPPEESRPGEVADRLGFSAAQCAVQATLTAVRVANRVG